MSPVFCSANKEQGTVLNEPVHMGLDDALEYIGDDELVEVSSACFAFCQFAAGLAKYAR